MTGQGTMTGKVFGGRYEIKDRIGIGGMAEVYRAQDSTLGRVVAVKVMLPQFAADPSFTQRFRQEAAAAAATPQRKTTKNRKSSTMFNSAVTTLSIMLYRTRPQMRR